MTTKILFLKYNMQLPSGLWSLVLFRGGGGRAYPGLWSQVLSGEEGVEGGEGGMGWGIGVSQSGPRTVISLSPVRILRSRRRTSLYIMQRKTLGVLLTARLRTPTR